MYIDTSHIRKHGTLYTRHLLRESYRENGKVRKRTIANLSACSMQEIEAMRLAFEHKNDLSSLKKKAAHASAAATIVVETRQGYSVGALLALQKIAKEIGLVKALGNDRAGRLALWQVFARVIDQGSRLSAVRLANQHAVNSLLNLSAFNEDTLYDNLDWLAEQQEKIEDTLYRELGTPSTQLYLYDVTSSYLEGGCNELAEFGYNRDKKKGKKQIVIGLLCNAEGIPLTVEVFKGNTNDPKTLEKKIEQTAKRFSVKEVTWVGDRGMIKHSQIESIKALDFHYITAITKSQIEALIKKDILQLSLFDSEVLEAFDGDIRYVFRRNPARTEEIERHREARIVSLQKSVEEENQYLEAHKRAKPETALKKLNEKNKRLGLNAWISLEPNQSNPRNIEMRIDEAAKKKSAKLDGCYVLKTDLSIASASKETLHARYKDLAMVEQAFRTFKTTHLDLRPIYVRRATRTRGHVFVVMLAYRLILELKKLWQDFDLTTEEAIQALTLLSSTEVVVNGKVLAHQIPRPHDTVKNLLKAAGVILPHTIDIKEQFVSTKMALPAHRKNR